MEKGHKNKFMNQAEIFFKKEADSWFTRNEGRLAAKKVEEDWTMRFIKKYKLRPKRVLEIGSSNGWRLNFINKIYGAKCTAVEPSAKAIKQGRKLYPKIDFRRGMAEKLPIKENEKFDMVVINYVFHWVDRNNIFKAFAEADRVLKNGGYLLFTDFYPDRPMRVPYHHLRGKNVFTYKMDYTSVFTLTGFYKLLKQVFYHHSYTLAKMKIKPEDRGVTSLLKKDINFLK
ncbi:MAG: class I SAM-dependent methyltransferase [Candidatus Pacebacteria bacterium]|nr:class I SAM-dependent methyltransferase [Candidatus Paceibacterota bacterium]